MNQPVAFVRPVAPPQTRRAVRADHERWFAYQRARYEAQQLATLLSDREAASLGLRRDAAGRLNAEVP